jgi:hypothetical protein
MRRSFMLAQPVGSWRILASFVIQTKSTMTPINFFRFLPMCGLAIILGGGLSACASHEKVDELSNKELDELLGTKPRDADSLETKTLSEKLEKRNRDYREYQERLEMRDRARWERRFPN